MTAQKAMNELQKDAFDKVSAMALIAADGRVSMYQARSGGARLPQLKFLVRHGYLIESFGEFRMPTGPYAGQVIMTETFYQVA